ALSPDAIRVESMAREPIWLIREPDGIRLVGQEDSLSRLTVANTRSRIVEHLHGRGQRVKTTTKPSGEVHITATGEGRRVINVVVRGHGEAKIDPQHFSGRECEGVMRDLAAAIEGTIVRSCPKPEYFNPAPVKVCGVTRG